MEKEKIALIKQTIDGSQVKDLKYKSVDNLIIGLVRDTLTGQPNRDYWVRCCWRPNGSVIARYGGNSRKELYLDLENIK